MLWVTRALWFCLPASVGWALDDATGSWSRATSTTFAIFAYSAWLIGLIALLLPSAQAFTALRIVAALPIVAVVVSAFGTSSPFMVMAAVHATFSTVFALSASVADASAQAQAYGDEIRRPLRTPPVFCVVTAVSVALIVAGVALGPILIASGKVAIGVTVAVGGIPIAAILVRAVHTLSQRFYVFVPAGLVIADSMLLTDPVLLASDRIDGFAQFDGVPHPDSNTTIDTRGGALVGCIAVQLNEPGSFAVRDGRRSMKMRTADVVMFTPLRPRDFLALAAPPTANPHVPVH